VTRPHRSATSRPAHPNITGEHASVSIGDLPLESGHVLTNAAISFGCWGTLAEDRSNVILLHHGLMGGCAAAPLDGRGGWFAPYIGPGRPLDTDKYWICCPNALGGCDGSTGPASLTRSGKRIGSNFPRLTVRDQVAGERRLADSLGISAWRLIVGPSMGGLRTLEWLVGDPAATLGAVILGSAAVVTAEQIAIRAAQADVIRADPHYHGGDFEVGGHCPRMAQASARCPGPETALRIARTAVVPWYVTNTLLAQRGGQDVACYARSLASRDTCGFDAGSYLALLDAMDTHDVGRGRGGVRAALGLVQATVTILGITSDRYYPVHLQEELAAYIRSPCLLELHDSIYGHDGVVADTAIVAPLLERALAESAREFEGDRTHRHAWHGRLSWTSLALLADTKGSRSSCRFSRQTLMANVIIFSCLCSVIFVPLSNPGPLTSRTC
jgi:homoserine O-acetyltransferase/O-succinyltransferase